MAAAPPCSDIRIRAALAGLATLFAAGPALALCPGRDDMAGGVRLSLDNGTTETYRIDPSGEVSGLIENDRGQKRRLVLQSGAYLISSAEIGPGGESTLFRTLWDLPVAALPHPAPGASWTGSVDVEWQGGVIPAQVQYDFGQPETLQIGDCAYEVLPMQMVQTEPDQRSVDLLYFFTELGFAWRHSILDGEYDQVVDVFEATEIDLGP